MWQKQAGFVAEVYSALSIRQVPPVASAVTRMFNLSELQSIVCSLALDSEYSDTVRLWVSLSTLPPPGLISEHSMSQPGTGT